ncbi:MAG TPA: hypothetical protein VF505_02750, partial [Thermoanaerobaculia bacterium]
MILILSLLVVLPLAAQPAQPLHKAMPVDQFLKQFWAAHPEMLDQAHHDHQLVAEMAPMQMASDAVMVNATKSFNIVARQFSFSVTPSPFVVNQGDVVSLDLTSSDVTHGFALQQFFENGVTMNKGQHQKVTFTANMPGTFTYACIVPSCGSGHFDMTGEFTVQAAPTPPTITSFTPRTGSA